MRLINTINAAGLLFTLALTGCGSDETPGNQAAYQQGTNNCSEEFIQDVNDVSNTVEAAQKSYRFDQAQHAVDQFNAKYRNVVCKARAYRGFADSYDTSVDANSMVDKWNLAIAKARRENTPASADATTQPSPVSTNTPGADSASALGKEITLTILDAATFNKVAQFGSGLAIQNGLFVDTAHMVYNSGDCMLSSNVWEDTFEAGTQLTFQFKDTYLSGEGLHAFYGYMELTCRRVSNIGKPWTLDELNEILGDVARVSSSK